MLTVLDEYTREALCVVVRSSMGAQDVLDAADFGEAFAIIGSVERKIHFLVMDMLHSDACFLKADPREAAKAFCDTDVTAFEFFDGVPVPILYDNTKIAVARILGDGTRKRTRVFSELVSHYL